MVWYPSLGWPSVLLDNALIVPWSRFLGDEFVCTATYCESVLSHKSPGTKSARTEIFGKARIRVRRYLELCETYIYLSFPWQVSRIWQCCQDNDVWQNHVPIRSAGLYCGLTNRQTLCRFCSHRMRLDQAKILISLVTYTMRYFWPVCRIACIRPLCLKIRRSLRSVMDQKLMQNWNTQGLRHWLCVTGRWSDETVWPRHLDILLRNLDKWLAQIVLIWLQTVYTR